MERFSGQHECIFKYSQIFISRTDIGPSKVKELLSKLRFSGRLFVCLSVSLFVCLSGVFLWNCS